MDSRDDSSRIGLVEVGLLKNHDAIFILKTPFQPQLQGLMNALTDPTANGGELLFQLRQFNFIETLGTRYCYLIVSLYAKEDARYNKISLLDTVIIVQSADVSRALTREGNKIIDDFIANALLKKPADTISYNNADIENIDSFEKRRVPVYNSTIFTDGIYTSWASFKNLAPGIQGFVETRRDGSISSVKIEDADGKKIKLKPKSIYAVINKGLLYIATEYGYYPLQKFRDNFIFTGDVKVAASSGDISAAQFGFGLIGAALASRGREERYDMLIDHLTGRFIHLVKIKTDAE